MDACKLFCLESDPVSGDPRTERRRKLKSGLTFELCTDNDGGLASWERGI